MRFPRVGNALRRHSPAWGAIALILAMNGCGLSEVDVPPLVGPSETGISLAMTASPDTISADGVSQSVVRITVRNQNGQPIAGRQIAVFLNAGDGFIVAGSVLVGPLQEAVSLLTDNNGIAQVVYVAGFNVGQVATIGARAYSFDATGSPFQNSVTVNILQL